MKNKFLTLTIMFVTATAQAKNVVQISIPKCGTHLLKKCIWSLTGTKSVAEDQINPYIASPEKFKHKSKNKTHWRNHLFYNESFEPFLNNSQNAFFFIYRDPRDQIVSFAYYMKLYNHSVKANEITFDQLLMELITSESGEIYNNQPPCKNINEIYKKYIPWLSATHVCSIRFEDLVGPKGGGNLEAQLNSIKKIIEHLGIFLTEDQIHQKAESLFGGTWTFRKGQIGSWKKHFNEDHKKVFKEVAGQLLIDFGYEESFDW